MSAVPTGVPPTPSFRDLALSEAVLRALSDVGYESPSPIQAATIPVLMSGADMLGQAQTGTGKTAAFALPALSRIDLARHEPQVLVLVPTRELALQVSEAFLRYAAHIKGFHVLPIYGGQSYQPQLNALRRGAHVVVGTPGRVIDHMNRGTLKLSGLTLLVLDEADEMLHMGFVDAVESILEQTPPQRQVALFSATLPAQIRRIAQKHLRTPVEVTIKSKTSTATNIRQRYWLVSGMHKLDALTRILEAEPFDGMLVFTRTKQSTVELAEKLEARGFAAAALNGDIPQALRERTVARLKAGQIDILVATDVAARGLDVERVGHVVNYDVPYDTESYVHRIGRTGRAGRSGEAILFIAPRERNMLRAIERATRQTIEPMNLPSVDAVNARRIDKFKERIAEASARPDTAAYRPILEDLQIQTGMPLIDIAAALASLAQGTLLLPGKSAPGPQTPERPQPDLRTPARSQDHTRTGHAEASRRVPAAATGPAIQNRAERPVAAPGLATQGVEAERPADAARDPSRLAPPHPSVPAPSVHAALPEARVRPSERAAAFERPRPRSTPSAADRPEMRSGEASTRLPARTAKSAGDRKSGRAQMETFRLEVGSSHGVKPGNIVGAIAGGSGIDGVHIGRVDIREELSFVDLPQGMPVAIFKSLQKVRVAGRELRLSRVAEKPPKPRKMLSRR